MDEKRMVIIGVGAVLAVSTITLLAVTLSAKPENDNVDVTEENVTYPLLLISLDGFRSDYIFRQLPTLETMAENGVTARFMMPSYPTITFPNHYTIVTGLYPESHGIVANSFYDPVYDESFSMGIKDGKWWGGEPMWNTLTRQNKTSATFFWPGSDCNISGIYPTTWREFDKTVPFENRVDQVVEWLSMPNRPDWVSLYFDEPDGTGHDFGPDTAEVDKILTYVDGMISRLLAGLRRNNMEDKVNIIVLADHGMARAGPEKYVNLTDYVPDIDSTTANISYGAFTMLRLKDSSEEAVNNTLHKLSCPAGSSYIRAFAPQDLPTRFHYSNNRRIGDIVLDFDSGYYTTRPNGTLENGEHGYDNHLSTMHALFIATGPDFKSGVTLEPFQNIEIYNLMCHLTGVEPAPNNGTKGSLYAALLDPPPTPEGPPARRPKMVICIALGALGVMEINSDLRVGQIRTAKSLITQEDELEVPLFPELTPDKLTMANCTDDLYLEEYEQLGLNISESDQERLVYLHLPWGIPSSGDLSAHDVLLLHHQDHVTGYSETLKMPLWTSFTVSNIRWPNLPIVPPYPWFSDVRLNETTTPTCDSYTNLTEAGRSVHMFPLFPPEFSASETLDLIPFLVSNAVPMYTSAKTVDYVAQFLAPSHMKEFAPFNMMLGPVFDKNADSLPDDLTDFKTPEVPSDIFVVVTRCTQSVNFLNECKEEDLDVVSFILPVLQTVDNNCKMEANYGNMFLATVHDVELATDFTFFPFLDPSVRLQLALRIHGEFWHINI